MDYFSIRMVQSCPILKLSGSQFVWSVFRLRDSLTKWHLVNKLFARFLKACQLNGSFKRVSGIRIPILFKSKSS